MQADYREANAAAVPSACHHSSRIAAGKKGAPAAVMRDVFGTVQAARLADEALDPSSIRYFKRTDGKRRRHFGDDRSKVAQWEFPDFDLDRAAALGHAGKSRFRRHGASQRVQAVVRTGARRFDLARTAFEQ